MNKILIVSLAIFVSASCADSPNKSDAKKVTKSNTDSVTIKQEIRQKNADLFVEQTKKEAQAHLPSLLKEFNLKKDKIHNGGWYTHKKSKNKTSSHIEAPVSLNGYIYLKAHYAGEDWIFANEIIAKIGDKTYYSSKLKTYDDFIVHDNTGGQVYETLHLTSPERDVSIIASIAFAPLELEITIRFNGDQKYNDIILTKADRQIIYDSWYLSQFISSNENEVELSLVTTNEKDQIFIAPKGNFPIGEIKLNNYK